MLATWQSTHITNEEDHNQSKSDSVEYSAFYNNQGIGFTNYLSVTREVNGHCVESTNVLTSQHLTSIYIIKLKSRQSPYVCLSICHADKLRGTAYIST